MMLRIVVKDVDKEKPEGIIKLFKISAEEDPVGQIKAIFKNGFNSGKIYYPPTVIQKISIFDASEGSESDKMGRSRNPNNIPKA